MSRIGSTVIVFLLLINGMSGAMAASGINDDLGVTLNPGIESQIETITENAEEGFSPTTTVTESFVGVSIAALGTFQVFVTAMTTGGPTMFINLGFPEWIVVPVFAPLYVVATLEFIYIVTGRILY